MIRALSIVLLGLAVPVAADNPPDGGDTQATPSVAATAAPSAPDVPASPSPTPAATPAPAPEPAGFAIRRIDFGLSDVDTDTNSSRFREYRSMPRGVVLPYLHFGGNGKVWYDVTAANVLQDDARYGVVVRPGDFEIRASYVRIPHLFGNNARTLLTEQGTGNWLMSDTLQQAFQTSIQNQFNVSKPGVNFAFLNGLLGPSLAAANTVNLRLERDRGQIEVRLTNNSPLDVRVSYFNENRRGDRAAGTSFGFGSIVETPEPIQYRTQDYGLSAEYTRAWGLVRGSFHYNEFDNRVPAETFDNPFRFTDSTDASAYQSPGSASIAGPKFGRVSLPPDNRAATGSLGFLVKFAGHSRLTTDVSLGQWTQNSAFIPMTTNTAISVPDQGLPGSLDGKIKTLSFSSTLTSRPVEHLHLTARFRRYDLDNQTPRIAFPAGYVRFDGVFEAIPRITVPFGVTTDALTLSAAYDFGKLTFEGGYKLDQVDRTFRETERTTQNLGYVRADFRARDWLVVHGTVEHGSRGYSGLEIGRSEDASFITPPAPVSILSIPSNSVQANGTPLCPAGTACNLRYDQAAKDIDRYGAHVELSPGSGKTTFTLSYVKGKDNYKETLYGLIRADNESFTAEVDFTASERVNFYGFYSYENISTFQRGRQSAATVSTSSLDDWTSDIRDRVDSFGGGATFGLVKEKADLKLFGNYQKVDGNNAIASAAGGAPALARVATGGVTSIPLFDDTKLYTLSAELAYKATKQLTLGFGASYEFYKLADAATTGLLNYVPASLFLAADDSNYKAHVLYVRASYLW